MTRPFRPLATALAFGFALTAALPAFADPPPDKGRNAHHGPERHEDARGGPGRDSGSVSIEMHFQDNDRMAVHDYYDNLGQHGRCPPGLAKKGTRCMPPGQARRWQVGHPLPHDVVFYDLPPELVVRLRPPPAGYRYVRVASDILMIAAGTGMVAAAIQDLAYN